MLNKISKYEADLGRIYGVFYFEFFNVFTDAHTIPCSSGIAELKSKLPSTSPSLEGMQFFLGLVEL